MAYRSTCCSLSNAVEQKSTSISVACGELSFVQMDTSIILSNTGLPKGIIVIRISVCVSCYWNGSDGV